MLWISISIIAYFLNALAITVDKFLLSKKINNPAVYAFLIASLSLVAIGLAPFGLQWYGWLALLPALLAGVLFTGGLLYMFTALGENEASRITPVIGGLQPIWILLLATIFLGETLTALSMLAFVLIIAGTVLISWPSGPQRPLNYRAAILATILFAASYTLNKYVFIDQDFITGFVWTRVGAFLGALLLLLSAANRRDIWQNLRHGDQQTGGLFVGGQIAGAVSFILINYAIAISPSVALVNALQGIQYVFLLVFVIILSRLFPRVLSERLTPSILIQKIAAMILIMVGLVCLFV